MREGCYVGTLITKECTKDDIINMMVGRVIYEDPKTESNVPKNAPVVLKVENLKAGNMVQNVSFELHKGEILGFSGLMGAGRTETARALFGADPKESGKIYINGKEVDIKNPMDAVRLWNVSSVCALIAATSAASTSVSGWVICARSIISV